MANDPQPPVAIRCAEGHVSYYDKTDLCGKYRVVQRGEASDAVNVPCKHAGCTQWTVVSLDCGGYR